MKFWSRAIRILLATIVASQGAVFLPAMAASQSKRLAVKAIGIEELKSEYGAGGGGGGTPTPVTSCNPEPTPPPNNDLPPVSPIDTPPFIIPIEGAPPLRIQAVVGARPQCAPVPPSCTTDLDGDSYCDEMGEEVALIQDYGSGIPTYVGC